jgi:flagellar operon protein
VSVELNPALLPADLGSVGPAAQPQPPATPGAGSPAGSPAPAGPSFADILKDASTTPGAGTQTRPPASSTTPASPAASASTIAPAGTGPQPLHFSKHALERIQRRGISLDPTTLGRLQEGVGRVTGKASRDSLVLVDGTAFVVSVPNRTVITAVGSEHMREHVFTNIDSAVIA